MDIREAERLRQAQRDAVLTNGPDAGRVVRRVTRRAARTAAELVALADADLPGVKVVRLTDPDNGRFFMYGKSPYGGSDVYEP
ncbi:MAG: hypothetical protein HZB16_07260 [Armatimonadetes bacterium]|nr:hypothetical protein [Armatimonadota bacterium]